MNDNEYRKNGLQLVIVLLFVSFWIPVAQASGESDECLRVSYPEAVETSIRYDAKERATRSPLLASVNPIDKDVAVKYLSGLRLSLLGDRAIKYMAEGNRDQYVQALREMEEALANKSLTISQAARDILRLFFYAQDSDMRKISTVFVDSALDELMDTKPGDGIPSDIIIPLVASIREMDQGRSMRTKKTIDSLGSEDLPSHLLFLKAFLQYRMGITTDSIEAMTDAAIDFQLLTENTQLNECNPILIGMSRYYITDLKLNLAEALEKKRKYDESISSGDVRRALDEARTSIEAARLNVDAIKVPVRWSMIHRKAADVYSRLGKEQEGMTPMIKSRLKGLEDRSHLLGKLF